jgi:hypothetical protein
MTSHFLTEKGETVELLCGLDHDFEGWPRRIRVRDVKSGAMTVILPSDLCPVKRDQFRSLVYALPDSRDASS